MSGFHNGGGRGGGRGGRGGGGGGGHHHQQQQYQPIQTGQSWGQQGGGGGGGGRGGGRGGNGGRRFHGRNSGGGRGGMGRGGAAAGEPEVYSICTFFAKSGNCRNGTSCQFAHVVNAFACVPASTLPIKTISLAEIGGEMKLLTGGVEPTIKVWNFTTGQVVMQTSLATAGPVEHIEVSGSYITWSVEEAIPECAPGDPNVLSGTVYMQDQTSNSTTTITREGVGFTHQQRVNCITIVAPYVVTAGLEGLIRAWQLMPDGKFNQVALLEGHTRSVTSLLYCPPFLWSGSLDHTLRVWDVATGRCAGTIASGGRNPEGGGHTQAVACLELIPAPAPDGESMVASGGADGEVHLWSPSGQFLHACGHGGVLVTAMRCFQDNRGGQMSLIIGLYDGRIVLRSCASMAILFTIPSNVFNCRAVWGLVNIPNSGCFASAGEDGQLVIWQVSGPLQDAAT